MKKEIQISSKNLNTLYSKFLTLLLFLSLTVVFITVFSLIYENKKEELYTLKQRSINLKAHFYADNLLISDFFIHDLINPDFYVSKRSRYIEEHDSLFKFLNAEIEYIRTKNSQNAFISQHENNLLAQELTNYETIFNSIVELSLLRGFQDFGYEGKMRQYAHTLETIEDFEKWKVLMLRRHEKDYIIRIQAKYIDLLQSKSKLYIQQTIESDLPQKSKDTIVTNLNLYLENFNKMAHLDSILGIKTNSGLTKNFLESKAKIQNSIDFIVTQMDKSIHQSAIRLKFLFAFISGLVVSLSFIFGLVFIRYLTRPISNLSKNIRAFVQSDFTDNNNFSYKTKTKEIVVLLENYFSMKEEILSLLTNFQRKVKERTEEIETQKEMIENQKLRVEKVNSEMLSSIKYAKRIQEAIMPSESLLNECFKSHFVIYKPRDIVSGDFLWFKQIKTKKKNLRLLAIADCTGHGVPGALMSMLSVAYLNEIVLRKEIAHAHEVMNLLRSHIMSYFQYDGLDLAFVVIDDNEKTLEFAGANRNLFIRRNAELIKLKGNRMPIGRFPTSKTFDSIVIDYKTDDYIFAFTDGITDQLSPEGRKFNTKNIIKKLETFNSLNELNADIEYSFKHWRSNNKQTDDILIFGAVL